MKGKVRLYHIQNPAVVPSNDKFNETKYPPSHLIETREPTGSVRHSEIIRQSRKTDPGLHKEYLSRYHTCLRIE